MRRTQKTALVAALTAGLVGSPIAAHAGHWGRFGPHGFGHHFRHVDGALVGLGIAGAVLGTAAIVDSLVNPPVVVYAPPPPPPPPSAYDEGYRRGYDEGRRDAHGDGRDYPSDEY